MERSYQTLAFLAVYFIVFGAICMVLASWESRVRKRKRQKELDRGK